MALCLMPPPYRRKTSLKLHVEVGQTHPKGVLWLLAKELVILFQSSDKMQVTACRVTKVTAWYKEPIRLHTSSPSTAHLRAYIAARDGWPSGAQSLTPDREEVPQSPPSNPYPDGRAQCQFHMDLGDAQLRLMEDLQQEVMHGELNVSPKGPTPGHWRIPAKDRDPCMDDEEVTFPGGRGWEPRGQPPQPTSPPQPEEDVGCRISTIATGLQLVTPRINTFSGKATLGKTEVSFKQWYYEVQYFKDHYPESVVREGIVRSLKGTVVDMA